MRLFIKMSSNNFNFKQVGIGRKHTTAKGERTIKIELDPVIKSIPEVDLNKFYLFEDKSGAWDYKIFGLIPKTKII